MRGFHRVAGAVLMAVFLVLSLIGMAASSAGTSPGSVPVAMGPADLQFQTVELSTGQATTLHSWFPGTNYAASSDLTLRTGDVASPLVRFDLSPIPSAAQVAVAKATLKLYVGYRTNAQPLTAAVYAVNRQWRAEQATWNDAAAGTPWGQSGCNAVPGDHDAVVADQVLIAEQDVWIALDVTDSVQGWLSGAIANDGLVVKASGRGSVAYNVYSFNYSLSSLRPKLEIIYAVIPTPAPTLTSTPTATPSPTPLTPGLYIEKTGPAGPLSSGQYAVTYNISVRSIGTQGAGVVAVTDMLPLGTVFLGCTHDGVYDLEDHTVTWNLGTLAIGEQKDISLDLGLAAWVKDTGTIVNVARASCTGCVAVEDYWETIVIPPTPTPSPTSTPTLIPTATPPPTLTPTATPTLLFMYWPQTMKGWVVPGR